MPDGPWWWNRRHFAFLSLLVALLLLTSIPNTGYTATAYAAPVSPSESEPTDSDESVAVSTLSQNCQQFARQLVDGQRVSERGYYLSDDDSPVLKTDNATGGWHHAEGFCIDQLRTTFRLDGSYYSIYWSSERGYRFDPWKADPLGLLQVHWVLRLVPSLYVGYLVSRESYRVLS